MITTSIVVAVLIVVAFLAGVYFAPYVSAEFKNMENDLKADILFLEDKLREAESKVATAVKSKKL